MHDYSNDWKDCLTKISEGIHLRMESVIKHDINDNLQDKIPYELLFRVRNSESQRYGFSRSTAYILEFLVEVISGLSLLVNVVLLNDFLKSDHLAWTTMMIILIAMPILMQCAPFLFWAHE